jgi:indole-3-glycerol phosphate synthase
MENILDKIVKAKRVLVDQNKKLIPVEKLEKSIYFDGPCISLEEYIKRPDKAGVIAEFKRASPSKGDINPFASAEKIPLAYMQAGASAVSVLTDEAFFKGRNEDLTQAREWNYSPILRKDFIIDEYQILEAKSIGADAILLILSLLDDRTRKSFIELAHQLGMEVLAEIHEEEEFSAAALEADLIGINSRSLKRMQVLPQHAIEIKQKLNLDKTTIAESGIHSAKEAWLMHQAGFDGFLIGTAFMETPDPGFACRQFIHHLEELKNKSAPV